MGTAPASVRAGGRVDDVDHMIRRIEDEWQTGRPDLLRCVKDLGPGRAVADLCRLIKADLRCRFRAGERPEVTEYLGLFPELQSHSDRILSLIYEEFCLLEERGDRPDVDCFCARYEPWKDSLASQLRYHSMFSQVAGGPPPPPFPDLGDQFQEFRLERELGRGGSARVYLARDQALGDREVALKIYPDRGSEASILGRLDHPHIVPVHSTPYQAETKLRGLCMPYWPGVTLEVVIRRVSPGSKPRSARAIWEALREPATSTSTGTATAVGPDDPSGPGWDSFPIRGRYVDGVAWLILKIAEALEHAHARKIQHRDVKPANVLLTFKEGPQLLDFNLAFDHHSPEQAEAALRGGTLPYMAPEQLDAFSDRDRWDAVDPRADLYALGLVMTELLTGAPPALPDPGLSPDRAIRELLDRRAGRLPKLRAANGRIPRALESIVEHSLAYAPGDRYQSASELAADLRQFLARRPLVHAPNPARIERATNWAGRHRIALGVFLTASLGWGVADHDRWLHPVEGRRPFLNAVEAIENGRGIDAIAPLTMLAAESPNSPVILMYKAFSDVQNRRPGAAELPVARLWSLPRAGETLTEWGRDHPLFAYQVADVGTSLLNHGLQAEPRVADRFRPVIQTLALAVRLDPANNPASIGLAAAFEAGGEFAEATRMASSLIDGIPNAKSNQGRRTLRKASQLRARILTSWSESLLDPKHRDADLGHPEERLKQALADLDRVDRLIEPNDEQAKYESAFVRCHALYRTAAVASRRGLRDRAVESLDQAESLFGIIRLRLKGNEFDHLAGRIRELRQVIEPR